VGEAVVAHDQCRQTIGKGVHAGARLVVGALVRPHNVETRVYARDRETMEGRVAEAERGEVVCVWKLLSCWSAYTVPHLQGAARKPALLTWCMISFRISIGRSSNFKGPLVAFSFPFDSTPCSADSVAFTMLGAGALIHTPSA
jgi:hypothetical protein